MGCVIEFHSQDDLDAYRAHTIPPEDMEDTLPRSASLLPNEGVLLGAMFIGTGTAPSTVFWDPVLAVYMPPWDAVVLVPRLRCFVTNRFCFALNLQLGFQRLENWLSTSSPSYAAKNAGAGRQHVS